MARRFHSTLDVRISTEAAAALDYYAERTGTPVSHVARWFLPTQIPQPTDGDEAEELEATIDDIRRAHEHQVEDAIAAHEADRHAA